MNYRKHYIKLMRKAQNRILSLNIYTEEHHIFPVSVFGKNKSFISLTAKEHYIAHMLLWKDFYKRYGENHYKTIKMGFAFWHMSNRTKRITSKLYASVRETAIKKPRGPLSEEHKKRLSTFNTGRKSSENTKNKISVAMTGRIISKEHRNRISEAHVGKSKHSEESKKLLSKIHTGVSLSDTHKESISKGLKNHKVSEETKKKISIKHTGKSLSEETKLKIANLQLTGITSDSLKNKINEIILNEDKTKPLSDQSIVNVLNLESITVSEITITRYRQLLGFATSRKRRNI